jgi:tetratricopeptide (TPR) repeat protein
MIVTAGYGRVALLIGVWCVSASVVQAQGTKPDIGRPVQEDRSVFGSIRGRVLLPSGNFISTNEKVTLLTFRDTVATIYTDGQGQFEFPDLNPGTYQVEVDPTDRQHFQVSIEQVQVFKGAPSVVTVTLKPHEALRTSLSSRSISVSELEKDIPANARKEFDRAVKASQRGLVGEAIAHLRKAIEIYPSFVMARNDLGVQLLSQGNLEGAAQELQAAVSLDSHSFNPLLNLGIVFVQQHRFTEAANVLHKALSLEPSSAAGRLYSGIASMALGNLDDAEKDLKSAYEVGGIPYALALFHLGQLYMNKGERRLARESFQRYLSDDPKATNADQVRKLIALLQ